MSEPGPVGEFGLIDWIRARTRVGGRTSLGIGDDCAALRVTTGADLLATTDMLMDGTHFRLDEAGPEAVGRKAIGVNLSDIAAMAGRPLAALVAVALPKGRAVELAQGVLAGMGPLAQRYGVDLVGGDTNAWDGPFVIAVTLLGETTPDGAVRRSGARPGDAIVVTGPLGGSLLGRHLDPRPRIDEALSINRRARPHAMIDVSDGLAADLGHILAESGGLGATLDADTIPIHPDAEALSRRDGRTPLEHALHDGEDFELCLTLDPADAEDLLARPPAGVTLHRIGVVDAGPGLRLATGGGLVPIEPRGYDHLG
jgi:thiamine-monophosphate kinase